MGDKFFCLLLVILFASCKNEITNNKLKLEEWNNSTTKLFSSRKCTGKVVYDANLYIKNIRANEIDLINNLIGIDNVDYIFEGAMHGSLLQPELRVLNKDGTLHVFKFDSEQQLFLYSESVEFIGKLNKIQNDCELLDDEYSFFIIQTKIEKGKIKSINIAY